MCDKETIMANTLRAAIAENIRIIARARLQEAPRAIPVDLAALSQHWHIAWHLAPIKGVPGFLIQEDSEWHIFLNQTLDPRIQRFTWAHEIGHALFHPLIGLHQWTNINDYHASILEIEANAFAAECLIPYPWLMRTVQNTGPFPWSADQWADISRHTVPRWAEQLQIFPNVLRYHLSHCQIAPPTHSTPLINSRNLPTMV